MGEQVSVEVWHDRVWRLAARDTPCVVHFVRSQERITRDMTALNRTLTAQGLTPGSTEWGTALYALTDRAWCESDACQGLWAFDYKDEWGCDCYGGDVVVNRHETWLFSDPVAALEFKLRWC